MGVANGIAYIYQDCYERTSMQVYQDSRYDLSLRQGFRSGSLTQPPPFDLLLCHFCNREQHYGIILGTLYIARTLHSCHCQDVHLVEGAPSQCRAYPLEQLGDNSLMGSTPVSHVHLWLLRLSVLRYDLESGIRTGGERSPHFIGQPKLLLTATRSENPRGSSRSIYSPHSPITSMSAG